MTAPIARALPDEAASFYNAALDTLEANEVPYLVGGAFAFQHYSSIARYTKDFDIFVRPRDIDRALAVLADQGYRTELAFPHWLAKAWSGDAFMDLIFNSGNGVVPVDDEWFEHAPRARVLGRTVRISPVEEMIWSKSFVLERERCDAADVAHLLLRCAESIDWPRLVRRFGPRWRVLLMHLVLFGFIYPSERARIPPEVIEELTARLLSDRHAGAPERVCNGTVISRAQYLIDVDHWGFEDGRLFPRGAMTAGDVAHWTAAIDESAR